MLRKYIEMQNDEYFVRDSRVTLASLVACWKEGLSPESIRDEFPTMSLEQVYGAIAFYLHHQPWVDAVFERSSDFLVRSQEQANMYPEITLKLRSAPQGARH